MGKWEVMKNGPSDLSMQKVWRTEIEGFMALPVDSAGIGEWVRQPVANDKQYTSLENALRWACRTSGKNVRVQAARRMENGTLYLCVRKVPAANRLL